jgi:hypothetical protein
MSRLPLALACLLAATGAGATEVYRCAVADRVSYQDKPCAKDATQSLLHLDDAAPPPPPPAAAPTADASPVDDAQPAQEPPAPALPARPPPDFFLCTATDGSHYLSEDGIGRRSAVPYAMLAGSGKSLAQAYAPNGIGVSAPELQKPPTIPARQDPLGASYVWVVDECHHADPQEACAYLHNEADKLDGKLRRAFSDTEKQLRQERATLRERLQGC